MKTIQKSSKNFGIFDGNKLICTFSEININEKTFITNITIKDNYNDTHIINKIISFM